MKSMDEVLSLLTVITEGLGKHFGTDCEFVVHDYSRDFESTIVAISNGNVTGREINQGGTTVGLNVLQGVEKSDGKFNYFRQTYDGRYIRSSTIYLKNDNGDVIGAFGINLDVTKMLQASNYLDDFVGMAKKESQHPSKLFNHIDELLVSMINDSITYIGTPVALMTKQQKIDGINYLASRGALRIKNAGDEIAKYYGISKFTIYNYLNGTKEENDETA